MTRRRNRRVVVLSSVVGVALVGAWRATRRVSPDVFGDRQTATTSPPVPEAVTPPPVIPRERLEPAHATTLVLPPLPPPAPPTDATPPPSTLEVLPSPSPDTLSTPMSSVMPLPAPPSPALPFPGLPLPSAERTPPWYRNRAVVFFVALLGTLLLIAAFMLSRGNSGMFAGSKPARVVKLHAGIAYGDELAFKSPSQLAASLNDAKTLGAHWVRVDFSWADVQRSSPSTYDWSGIDRIVAGARARGLHVLPVLAYTPAWARTPGCDSQSCKPASVAAFATFAKAAATRYAPLGVHTWEIWNEENSASFWEPSPSPRDYVTLLRYAVNAIHAVDTHAFIVSGGLAAVTTRDGDIDQTDFLRRVSELGGNKMIDAVGYHPYTYPLLPSLETSFHTAWDRIDRAPVSLHSVLARYGTPDMPIWLTEYGAPTGGPGSGSSGAQSSTTTHVTEARQAQILVDAVSTAWGDDHIQGLFIYEDRDRGGSSSTNENFYGVRRENGSKKPAFAALRKALLSLGSGVS